MMQTWSPFSSLNGGSGAGGWGCAASAWGALGAPPKDASAATSAATGTSSRPARERERPPGMVYLRRNCEGHLERP